MQSCAGAGREQGASNEAVMSEGCKGGKGKEELKAMKSCGGQPTDTWLAGFDASAQVGATWLRMILGTMAAELTSDWIMASRRPCRCSVGLCTA